MLHFFKKQKTQGVSLPPVTLPLKSVYEIDAVGVHYKEGDGKCTAIAFSDAYKGWCKSKAVRRAKPKYVCDRAKSQKRIVFYTEQETVFLADEGEEDLWVDLLNRIQLQGYSSFDID